VGWFDGRTVAVSGAAGGIGRACARRLAAEGAGVALLDIAPDGAGRTADLIAADGGRCAVYGVDVSAGATVEDALDRAELDLGPVTMAVGAAGVIRHVPFLELTEAAWERTMAVNLRGMFVLLQSTARRAARHGGGSMVAISSVAGRGGRPTAADYAASKAGVISLVRSAASALAGDGITVNAVCPGVVDTEMTRVIHRDKAGIFGTTPEESFRRQAAQIPLGRIGSPEEVAGVVAFLLTPAASYMTGQALNVCGGLEMD
jgi:NAD(P)-dependent dehydrogenase (short-subunit alcohol dehydrogenase family)